MASRVEREKCSAGACPQPGPRAQQTGNGGLPQSFTPPTSSFVRKHVPDSDPGCAYAAFERAVEPLHSAISSFRPPNSSFPRRRESRGEVRVVAMTLELSHQPMHPIFIPWCAGTSRHERLL